VQRLQQMENSTGAAEEQEEPMTPGAQNRVQRRMRENTQPLGMAVVPSY